MPSFRRASDEIESCCRPQQEREEKLVQRKTTKEKSKERIAVGRSSSDSPRSTPATTTSFSSQRRLCRATEVLLSTKAARWRERTSWLSHARGRRQRSPPRCEREKEKGKRRVGSERESVASPYSHEGASLDLLLPLFWILFSSWFSASFLHLKASEERAGQDSPSLPSRAQ